MPKGSGKGKRGSERRDGYTLNYPERKVRWEGFKKAPQGGGMKIGKLVRDSSPQKLTIPGVRRSVQGTPEQAVNRTNKADKKKK